MASVQDNQGERRDGTVAHPDLYPWFVLAGVIDTLVTWTVLRAGGWEVNVIAQLAIELAGHWGLIGLKVLSIVVFLVVCEAITARRAQAGRRLAVVAVGLAAFPPVVGLVQLAAAGGLLAARA